MGKCILVYTQFVCQSSHRGTSHCYNGMALLRTLEALFDSVATIRQVERGNPLVGPPQPLIVHK